MTDKQVDIFLAAAQCGSFAKAEKELYLSRQAIMKQIDRLEAEIGVQLFVRAPSGLSLTPAGVRLRDGLIPLRKQMRRLLAACRSESEAARRLCIEIPRHPISMLDQAIAQFSRRFPEITLDIVRAPSPGRVQRLLEGKIDIAEIPYRAEVAVPGVQYMRLANNPFFCLVSQEHPLARRGSIHPQDLLGFEVHVNSLNGRRPLIEALRREAPDLVFKETSGEEMEALLNVCYNNGVYITPAFFATRMEYLAAAPLACDVRQEIGLICRSERNETVDRFIEIVRGLCPPPPPPESAHDFFPRT